MITNQVPVTEAPSLFGTLHRVILRTKDLLGSLDNVNRHAGLHRTVVSVAAHALSLCVCRVGGRGGGGGGRKHDEKSLR